MEINVKVKEIMGSVDDPFVYIFFYFEGKHCSYVIDKKYYESLKKNNQFERYVTDRVHKNVIRAINIDIKEEEID